MKNISKRIVALVLAVAMMVTSLPTMVSAATSGPHLSGHTIGKYGESHTLTLEDDGTEHTLFTSKTQIENIEWSISNSPEAIAAGKQAVVINEAFTDYSRGRGVDELETKAKLEIYDAFEGQVTINAKLTYQKYKWVISGIAGLTSHFEKDGRSYTVDMQPYTFTVSPDYTISLNVGETKEIEAIGSADWYDWTQINDNVYSTYSTDRSYLWGLINVDKLNIRAEKPGVAYFYKDGANKYLYKVVVTGEEPQPVDPDPINPVLPGILCGTYTVHPGDEFTLQINGEDLRPNDITKDSDASNVPSVFTQKANNAAEKFTYIVSENAELKEYRIYLQGKGNNKDKKYYWIINVTARPAVELDVVYEGLDDLSENAIKDFDELDTVLDNELDTISTDITDYVEETYSENGMKYTLDEDASSVTVSKNTEDKEAVVTISAVYTSEAITYKNKVVITANPAELTAETVKLESVSLDEEDSTYDAQISKEVKDYVVEFPETEDAAYKLDRGNVTVNETTSEDGLTVTRTINVTANYEKTTKVTVTIKHRLSFVWNNVDELAKDESKVFKTETKKIKVTDLEKFVSEDYQKLIDKDHDWNGNARYNERAKTLEILYKAKKVNITKTFDNVPTKTVTTYYDFKELDDYNFDTMTKDEFKAKFYNAESVMFYNTLYKYADSTVNASGTIANITVKYQIAKYTVTYQDPNGNVLGTETVSYNGTATDGWKYSSRVNGFKGWVDEEGKAVNFSGIKADMTVKACLKDKVTIKHVLDWYGEKKLISTEEVFKLDNALQYLCYALEGYTNPQIDKVTNNEVTIKYYANKLNVKFVDKKGKEIKEAVSTLINYSILPVHQKVGFDYANGKYEADETIYDADLYATYTLDKKATKVDFDVNKWNLFDGATIINITYKYDVEYETRRIAINYMYKNAYGEDVKAGEYHFTMDKKDRTLENVEKISDEHIPAGFEKAEALKDSYKNYTPEEEAAKAEHWYRQNLKVAGRQENKTLTYSVGKYWHLTKENGTYKRASDWSDKDWYRFPNEAITVVGKIPTNYGFKEKTVDGMTFNNSNVTWNPVLSGDFVNGFYDNDGTKDGVVVGNYYITNADNAEGLYAQANLTFKLEGDKTAAFDGSKFVEYPVENEPKVIVWKEIKLENNNYNVYGVRTNTPRSDEKDTFTIQFEQALPLGMRNASIENVKKYVLDSICEKAADAVEEKEGALREEDIKHGSSVIEIEEDDFYNLVSETGSVDNNILSCTGTITSNYYKYSLAVTLVERNLEGASFRQDRTTKELATKQAINNAVDAVKENTSFSELVFDKENATVTGLPETTYVDEGEYSLVVTLTTTDGTHTFEVKVPFTATWSRSSGGSNTKPEEPINIDPNMTPEAGALLDDLRNNRPNDLITRAEFIGILSNLFQVPEDREYDKKWNLDDCAQQEMIKKFATYTIVKGYSDEEFGQNDTITKEQMYTILARTLIFQGKCQGMTEDEIVAQLMNAVNSEQVSDWAREGVSIALQMGLAAATETTPTEPQGNVMRMTAADTLQKYIEIIAADTTADDVKIVEE